MRTVAISEPASWMTKTLCPCLHPLSFRLSTREQYPVFVSITKPFRRYEMQL